MKIAIIGTGYVGLVTGACLAELGNRVTCVDNNSEKIQTLNSGTIPIFEPDLEEIVKRNVNAKRLFFSIDLPASIRENDVIFIAVGTPSKENGEADLSFVEGVARKIAQHSQNPKIVVEKSTVPVETGRRLQALLTSHNGNKTRFEVVSNPEFLREGSAIHDFLHPERVVIGTNSESARAKMQELYGPLNSPIIFTDINSAELIKHASNSFLALKISYANAIANICELTGADVEEVTYGMGLDSRIGKQFLRAGIGFGGSCFPKDVDAFIRIAKQKGYSFGLLEEVQRINAFQRKHFFEKIKKRLGSLKGKSLAVLGLAFKPNTDDLRHAPSLDLVPWLQKEGALVRVFDPVAMNPARLKFDSLPNVQFCADEFEAMNLADAVLILTEWQQFKELDWEKANAVLKKALIFDGRNLFVPNRMKQLGFEYISVGRDAL
ncbi:UDP-glucose/GDP-mannose dehydrogenase family protein [Candidatus Micrarchaeota archaeon]|nr:UDP-glucose/GDP-mannose dehydrogenase family protein [Candidatus Micrarchaeota archaeon]MBU1930717.1 UDP-glucose/GDP-mannose dehydrogenase family protein [Candidatus Micrarchaeota archaeon]